MDAEPPQIEHREKQSKGKRTILFSREEKLKRNAATFSSSIHMELGLEGEGTELFVTKQKTPDGNVLTVFEEDIVHNLNKDHLKIGRSVNPQSQNDVILTNGTVSNRHCELGAIDDRIGVSDDSSNGTIVKELRELQGKERIVIPPGGSLVFRLSTNPVYTDIGIGNNTTTPFSLNDEGELLARGKPFLHLLKRARDPNKPLRITFGSDTKSNDFIVEGEHVAPQAMELTLRGDIVEIRDLSNTYGIYIATKEYIDQNKEEFNGNANANSPEQTENKIAEKIAGEIFRKGAGYAYGPLYYIQDLTPGLHYSRPGIGYSEGLVFVQGKVLPIGQPISEQYTDILRTLSPVTESGNNYDRYINEYGRLTRYAEDYPGVGIHLFFKEPYSPHIYKVKVGERVVTPKKLFRDEVREAVYEERIANIDGFTPGNDWVTYTFKTVSQEAKDIGRDFMCKLVVPPEVSQQIDIASHDPTIPLKILKSLYPGQLGENRETQLTFAPQTKLIKVDRTREREVITEIPVSS